MLCIIVHLVLDGSVCDTWTGSVPEIYMHKAEVKLTKSIPEYPLQNIR